MTNKQLLSRIAQIVVVLLGISFITFALVMLSPGDPVRQMIAGNEDIIVSQQEIDALRHELGLDKPFIFQYLDWLGRAVQGDFGFSYMVKKPVVEQLMESLPATVILALASTVFMLVVSIPAGIYSAVKHGSVFDYVVRGLTFVGVSVPNFWMGLMLLWIFGLKLRLLPIVGGRVSLETLILPALTLGIVMASKFTRQVRTAVLEELNQDYVVGGGTEPGLRCGCACPRHERKPYFMERSSAQRHASVDYAAWPFLRQPARWRCRCGNCIFVAGAGLPCGAKHYLPRFSAGAGHCAVDCADVHGN